MKTGDYVRCFCDANDRAGYQACYGLVIAAGPKAFKVRWESGVVQRRPQSCHLVSLAPDQSFAKECVDKSLAWRHEPLEDCG